MKGKLVVASRPHPPTSPDLAPPCAAIMPLQCAGTQPSSIWPLEDAVEFQGVAAELRSAAAGEPGVARLRCWPIAARGPAQSYLQGCSLPPCVAPKLALTSCRWAQAQCLATRCKTAAQAMLRLWEPDPPGPVRPPMPAPRPGRAGRAAAAGRGAGRGARVPPVHGPVLHGARAVRQAGRGAELPTGEQR